MDNTPIQHRYNTDIIQYAHGTLFSGIGGFDLAAEWIGWTNIFHCEINEFCNRILKYYWPNATQHKDIRETDFTIYRGRIDVLSGGFPCQPFSVAGKRKGTEDDRNLWPEFNRAITEIQPTWVVGENVPGIINWNGGLVFEQVQADLENAGYEVQPIILPACGKNAPHKRERVWFIANRNSSNINISIQQWGQNEAENINTEGQDEGRIAPDTDKNTGRNKKWKLSEQQEYGRHLQEIQGAIPKRDVTNPEKTKRKQSGNTRDRRAGLTDIYTTEINANTESQGLEGTITKRTAQKGRCNLQYSEFDRFPTQSPVRGRNDGLSGELDGITLSKWRNESLMGFGNSIVPEIAFEIFNVLDQIGLKSQQSGGKKNK